ncbi:permease [Paracidovorax avenae]|uniref:sulfite exporter TauE/SafE family protein n=1 Tax=Paracidovorax avenae TaxID=80867 RepID=UPI000D17C692|nr:sulfite exporter TauE/SafE family protein [Paracidovorax avenae]AVS89535.1 permease [Paracidovorax avenae]
MDTTTAIVVLGAVAGGFVQGLSGFAFGLTAMSFWAWAVDPRLAASLAVFGALTGQVIAAFSVRRGAHLSSLWPFVAGGMAGIPLGVAVLPYLDVRLFKLVLGTLLVLWCPAMLWARNLPAITWGGRLADGLVGTLGGVLGGIGGFTGTAPTLWCTLKRWDKDRQRAVIQNFNLSTLAVTMGIYVSSGVVTRDALPFFALVAPAMLVPTLLGSRVYTGISDATFRKVVLSLLTLSGIALVASGLRG